ncbi:hypothetical protein JX265_011360 [Neoarthrinium moseri]|uniref:Uncharacterized protein n=1 Tax=Neoarthrinium moseri TaxID=1658444 RepID=A0A9Q0AKW8_9PEZI|nr:hypothetical protein JX265_011360 [Neoarthrinium moseri]
MVLKRKRSESELSLSSCGTAFSSPPRPDASHAGMDLTSPTPSCRSGMATPSHLPSRTMKRIRDSRPSDEEVHRKFYEWRAHHQHQHRRGGSRGSCAAMTTERTIDMLFSAARKTQAQTQPQPQYQQDDRQSAPQPQQQQQASLHAFWNIPAPTQSADSTWGVVSPPRIDTASLYAPSNCEDCGQGLRGGDGSDDMDVDMDGDGLGADTTETTGCAGCGKHVCTHCSITNLGQQRQCLICAGKKVWVGGLGWTAGAVGVC